MSVKPLVSVVVPAYNGGKYLDRAIASVLGQTLPNFEMILVDDGSTDGAVDRARLIKDSRLTIVSQANAGAPSALNRGISVARGEYIAFLDPDDLWAPSKLERHVEYFAAHPEADVTFTGLVYIDPDDQPLGLPPRKRAGCFGFEELFIDNVVGSSSALAGRRQAIAAIGGFDQSMLYLFDIDFILRIARLRLFNVVAIPECLTLYRRHPGQQTSDWRMIARYWAKLVDKYQALDPVQTKRLESRAERNMTRYLSYLAYEQGDPSTAWILLRRALDADPILFSRDPRNWKLGLACSAGMLLPRRLHEWLARQMGLRHVLAQPKRSR